MTMLQGIGEGAEDSELWTVHHIASVYHVVFSQNKCHYWRKRLLRRLNSKVGQWFSDLVNVQGRVGRVPACRLALLPVVVHHCGSTGGRSQQVIGQVARCCHCHCNVHSMSPWRHSPLPLCCSRSLNASHRPMDIRGKGSREVVEREPAEGDPVDWWQG